MLPRAVLGVDKSLGDIAPPTPEEGPFLTSIECPICTMHHVLCILDIGVVNVLIGRAAPIPVHKVLLDVIVCAFAAALAEGRTN